MANDDHLLVKAFDRHRDESSFRQLYRQHTPAVFAMAIRLSGSHAEAEELTQEAWCRAVERFDTFRRQSTVRTWLIGILINCHREAIRKQARTRPASDDEIERLSDELVTPLPVSPRKPADPIDVERALSKLPDGYREVILLHDLNGYTHKEIANMLGIQEGTSKSQLKRGRDYLRNLLRETTKTSSAADKRGTS